LAAALVVAVAVALVWASLASGTQPYETYESRVGEDEPVAQFRFDDTGGATTVADSVGSYTAVNHGTVLGGAGPFGGSKSGLFEEGYAALTGDPLEGATEWTAEAWVKWSGGTSYEQPIFDFGSSAGNHMYLTPASSSSGHEMLLEIHPSEGPSAQVSATTLASGSWHYIAVTESSTGTLTLYEDGAQVGQTSGASVYPSSLGETATDYLGKSLVSATPDFEGSLSNVAFYTKALSGVQIQAHWDEAEYPVNATAPSISGTARDGSVLTVNANSWTGLTPITFSYQWRRCNEAGEACSNISAATTSEYTASHGDVGSTLRAVVGASNSAGSGSVTTPATPEIAAASPTDTSLPGLSGEAIDGGVLSSSHGEWEGTPTITFTYQWARCSSAGGECSPIAEATAAAYTATHGDVGHKLRLTVTAHNAAGSESASVTTAVAIAPAPPSNTSAPTVEGVYEEGQTLTATAGSWSGTLLIGFGYQWQRCNSEGSACASIGGATGTTYVIRPGDVGHPLRVLVTATNATGEAEEASEPGAVVLAEGAESASLEEAAPPQITGATILGQTVEATTGEWSGSTPVTYEYQWQTCDTLTEACTNIAAATEPSYTISALEAGMAIRVLVTATNADGSATSASSIRPVEEGLPPTIEGAPHAGEVLTANAGTWFEAPEELEEPPEAPPTLSYQWKRCNASGASCVSIVEAEEAEYEVTAEDEEHTLRVTVEATRPGGSTSATSAATGVVGTSTPPANTSKPSISGTLAFGQTASASTGAWSGTGTIAYDYMWEVCTTADECTEVVGATTSSLALTHRFVGRMLRVRVGAEDADGRSTATSEPSQPIAEAGYPVVVAAPTVSGTALQGETLKASFGEWANSTGASYAYQWERCGAHGSNCEGIRSATETTYTLGLADVGSTVRVAVTAHTSSGETAGYSTVTEIVAADSLHNTQIPQITGSPNVGATLSANSGTWTGSGTIEYQYQWQTCDSLGQNCSPISGADASTYEAQTSDGGKTLRVQVTAGNSTSSASATSDASATIKVALPHVTVSPSIEGAPALGEHLVANPGTWGGPTPITVALQWLRCDEHGTSCAAIPGQTAAEYVVAEADVGHVLAVRSTASNAGGEASRVAVLEGGPVEEPAEAPSVVEEGSVGGEPVVGETVEVEVGRWSGSQPITYEYQWERCPETRSVCEPILGATSPAYTVTEADGGAKLQVTVTGENSSGQAGETVWLFGEVETPPVETGAPHPFSFPSVHGPAKVGSTLVASHGVWVGSQPIAFTYQWQRCDPEFIVCSNISGATTASYTVTSEDEGQILLVRVTAANEAGETTEEAFAGLVRAVGSLELESSPEIEGEPHAGETLSVSTGVWVGDTPISYAYQWERCNESWEECAPISGVTSSTYTLGEEDVGHRVEVQVTAENAHGQETAFGFLFGGTVTPAGGVENLLSPHVEGEPGVGSELAVDPGTWLGATPIEFLYQWQRCAPGHVACSDIPGATESTYTVAPEDAGGTLQVLVTAKNAVSEASETAWLFGIVGNPPAAIESPALSGVAEDGHTLHVTEGSWDESEGGVSVGYQWQRCTVEVTECTNIEGAEEPEYTLTDEDLGHTVRAAVSGQNQYGWDTVHTSASSEVLAGGPVGQMPFADEEGPGPYPGAKLIADYAEPLGLGPIEESYEWERCSPGGTECASIAGAEERKYLLTGEDVGHSIRVSVTYTNAHGEDRETSEPSAEIEESTPIDVEGPTLGYEDIGLSAGDLVTAHPGSWVGGESVSYTYQWQLCGGSGCHDISGAEEQTVTAPNSEGSLRVVVTATDTAGSSTDSSAQVRIFPTGGRPAIVGAAAISGEPLVGAVLTVSNGEWHGAPTGYSYSWESCTAAGRCETIGGAEGETLELTTDEDAKYVRADVTATNANGSSTYTTERVGPVPAIAPVNVEEPMVEGEAVAGNVLMATSGSWLYNTDSFTTVGYSYRWQLCDAVGASCEDIEGEEAQTSEYALTTGEIGSTVRVAVSTSSPRGELDAIAYSKPTAVVATAVAVSNTTAPSIEGTAQDGVALTADPGTWTGSPVIHFSYQWERCEAVGETCTAIAGATEESYTAKRGDRGKRLRVTVTATNGAGSHSATSSMTGSVAEPGAPSSTVAPQLPAYFENFPGEPEFRVGDLVTATPGEWAGDPTVVYQWQRCDISGAETSCTDIPGATGTSYVVRPADVGYALNLHEAAENPTGSATAETGASSKAVTLGGAGAGFSAQEHGAAVPGQTITVEPSVFDGYELPYSLSYEFLLEDGSEPATVLQSGASAELVVPGEALGDRIEIVALASFKRADDATTVLVDERKLRTHVVEAAPTNTAAPTITSTQAQAGATLTAHNGTWEGGGGSLEFSYAWTLCDAGGGACEAIEGAVGQQYTTTAAEVGGTIRVVVTASDEGSSGTAESSATEPISAAEGPVSVSAPTVTGEPQELETLTASTGEWEGSAPIAYSYQWEGCSEAEGGCLAIPGATTSTYRVGPVALGEKLRVTVRASNQGGTSSETSAETAVVSSAPMPASTAAPSVTLLGPPAPGAVATTDGGSWANVDLGSQAGSLSYQWQRCNSSGGACVDVEEASSPSYDVTEEDIGSRLRVEVTAESDSGEASSASELTPTIEETAPPGGEDLLFTEGETVYASGVTTGEAQPLANCSQIEPGFSGGCELMHPSISSTGESVAVEARPSGRSYCGDETLCQRSELAPEAKIMIANYDGSDPRVLPGEASQPTWAPDGTDLVFTKVSTPPGGEPVAQLYTANAAGGEGEPQEPTPLPTGTAYSESPVFSADGTKLAFIGKSSAHAPWRLYVANSDGSGATAIEVGSLGAIDQPEFAAGGSKLLFDAVPPAGSFDPEAEPRVEPSISSIYEVNTNGTGLTRLTHDKEEHVDPTVITETRIVYVAEQVILLESGAGIAKQVLPGHLETITTTEETEEETILLPDNHSVTELTVGVLGFTGKHRVIKRRAPDGWCSNHLIGVSEPKWSRGHKLYRTFTTDQTQHVKRGPNTYSIGISAEKSFDCEGGTSHVYWAPSWETKELETSVNLLAAAERYDGTIGHARETSVNGGKIGPALGDEDNALLLEWPRFSVRAAKLHAHDPRLWEFSLAAEPEDSGEAYALIIAAINGLKEAISGKSNFHGVVADQKYLEWLPPGCYKSTAASAHAAGCH
jgi:hypothetical protein